MQSSEGEPPPSLDPVPLLPRITFCQEVTFVGKPVGLALIVVIYTLALAGASTYDWTGLIPLALALHVMIDMCVDAPTHDKFLRFVNEIAVGVAAGWIGFLVLVFTIGIFLLSGEKGFGVAFGAGIGLMVVFTPALIVSIICTGILISRSQNRT
jgi:hypothetical protein